MNKIVTGILLIAALAIHSAGGTEANPEKAGFNTKQDIRDFLLEVTNTNPDQTEITDLIEELGSPSYSDRARAERSLMNRNVPLGLLQKASKSSNLERASRAARILEVAGPTKKQRTLLALQTIEEGAISGLSREVIDVFAVFEDDPVIFGAARKAMLASVSNDEVALLKSKVEPKNIRCVQKLSILALRKLKEPALADPFAIWAADMELPECTRLESTLALADLGDRRSLRLLVDLLIDADLLEIRTISKTALKKLTGEDIQFAVYSAQKEHAEQAEKLRTWLETKGREIKLIYPLGNVRPNTLVALSNQKKIVELDADLNEVWSFDSAYPTSIEKMENGNILIAEWHTKRVIEINRNKEIVWQYDVGAASSAQPLKNGNVLISTTQKNLVFEVDRDGKTVWKLTTGGEEFSDAVRMKNGNTLVARYAKSERIAEFTPEGKCIWKSNLGFNSSIDSIQSLDNGNVLVSLIRGDVLEIDKTTNEVVWSLEDVGARDAHRLENGNTLVLTKTRVFETRRARNYGLRME